MARADEKAALDNFRRELDALERGICPTERSGVGDVEHVERHPAYTDCATEIVAALQSIQTSIRNHSWTPRSTAQSVARALRGRIDTDIEIMVEDHAARR